MTGGGLETVSAGGLALDTQVQPGGVLVVDGGIASGTLVYDGTESVASGGTIWATLVSGYGAELISAGGTAFGVGLGIVALAGVTWYLRKAR